MTYVITSNGKYIGTLECESLSYGMLELMHWVETYPNVNIVPKEVNVKISFTESEAEDLAYNARNAVNSIVDSRLIEVDNTSINIEIMTGDNNNEV